MTITSSVKLAGGTLSVCGRTVLSGVPAAVAASSAAAAGAVDGVFIGADLAEPASHHVISLGTIRSGADTEEHEKKIPFFRSIPLHIDSDFSWG